MPDPAALVSAAVKIGEIFEALLKEGAVQDRYEARIAACIYLTIAELNLGVVATLRSRAQSHAPVLVRSMHEALADLKNVVEDPAYANQMRFDNADQMLKTFKGFLDAPDLQDDEEAKKSLAGWVSKEKKIFDELKAKGFTPLSSCWTSSRKLGWQTSMRRVYRFLCSFSHNDLNTLLGRHGAVDKLRFTDPLPAEMLHSVVYFLIGIYGRAVETLPKYTTLSAEKVKTAIDSADDVWSEAQKTEKGARLLQNTSLLSPIDGLSAEAATPPPGATDRLCARASFTRDTNATA